MSLHVATQGGPGRHRPVRRFQQVLYAVGVGIAVDFRQVLRSPGASRSPGPAPEPVSAGVVPSPAAVAPRLRLGAGLVAAPARTGPAQRDAVGGPAHRVAPFGTKMQNEALPTPVRGLEPGALRGPWTWDGSKSWADV